VLAIHHARRPFRRPAAWHAGRVLALIMALTLLLVGCNGDDEDDPGDDTAAGTAEETPAAGDAEGEEPPDEPVTIRIGWHTPGQEFAYVMQQNPEVAPNHGTWYEIEWTQLPPAQEPQSLASDVTDGGVLASVAAANVIEQGADIVITGVPVVEQTPNTPITWLVRSDSGIGSPADLAGQTVGTIGEGLHADLVADHVIRTDGGLEAGQDYDKANVQFPQMMDALLAGQIAAGPFPPPFLQQALATGEVEPLFTTLDAVDPIVPVVQAFRRDFVEDNQAVMEKFQEDWATVWQWIADPANRQEVLEATSAATEIPVEVLDQYLLTEEDAARPPNGSVDQDALQATWDFFREEGALTEELNLSDHVIEDLLPPEE
jgi:ABC-type nitrate/sulfonate/bicarbonate transport system substrate-binding protein